jgi:hypothetical protein
VAARLHPLRAGLRRVIVAERIRAVLLHHRVPEAPMAVDIQKLFNEELPAQLAKHTDAAKAIGATYQMNIVGEGGGEWFIDVSEKGPSASQSNPGTADCSITMTVEDFQKLHENPQANGMQLFFAGKLKITGNNMLAMKLSKLFSLGG